MGRARLISVNLVSLVARRYPCLLDTACTDHREYDPLLGRHRNNLTAHVTVLPWAGVSHLAACPKCRQFLCRNCLITSVGTTSTCRHSVHIFGSWSGCTEISIVDISLRSLLTCKRRSLPNNLFNASALCNCRNIFVIHAWRRWLKMWNATCYSFAILMSVSFGKNGSY